MWPTSPQQPVIPCQEAADVCIGPGTDAGRSGLSSAIGSNSASRSVHLIGSVTFNAGPDYSRSPSAVMPRPVSARSATSSDAGEPNTMVYVADLYALHGDGRS
jgi:hypothetical protein